MKNLDLVILAGGKGSRIKNFLKNNSNPMMKFHKISFLQYLINNYSKYPIKNIYILTGYRSNQIHKKFHNKIYRLDNTDTLCFYAYVFSKINSRDNGMASNNVV